MAKFQYVGRTRDGKRSKGSIVANSDRDATLQLKNDGILVLELKEIKDTLLNKELSFGNPVKHQDFVVYLRQFSTLLKAGVTIVEATKILADQSESKALKATLKEIEMDVRAGISFSAAAAKHPKVLPEMFINMFEAGEVSGSVDEALVRLANHYEKQYKTRQKVKSALAYPIVIGIIAIAVITFLLISVVPMFAEMLSDLGGELPGITKFVLGVSNFIQQFWWLIILIVIGCIVAFVMTKKNPKGKYFLDHAFMKIPVFGNLIQKSLLARFSRTLCSLFSSSVPILEAIQIVEKVVGNSVIAKTLKEARRSLEAGRPLTEPLKDHWVYPALVVQMISIGEETGSLDEMLEKIAEFYEEEVDNITDRLKSLIEPIMIVILAAIVGVIVISIMMPMFEIYNSF